MEPRCPVVLTSTALIEQGLAFDIKTHKFAYSSDFSDFIEQGWFFYDKSAYIAHVLQQTGVTVFTSPAESGRTFFINMLESFFAPYTKVSKQKFAAMKIARINTVDNESILDLHGTIPVLRLRMMWARHSNSSTGKEQFTKYLQRAVAECCGKYDALSLPSEVTQSEAFSSPITGNYERSPAGCGQALREFITLLRKHYGKKVMILIDDYDYPYTLSHTHHRQAALEATSEFYLTFLENNDDLHHALLMGTLHVPYRMEYKHFSYTSPEWRGWYGITMDEAKVVFNHQSPEELGELNREAGGYHEDKQTVDLNSVVHYIMDWSLEDPDNERGFQNNFLYHQYLPIGEVLLSTLSFKEHDVGLFSEARVSISTSMRLQCLLQLNSLLEQREGILVNSFDPCQPIDLAAFDQSTMLFLASLIQLGFLGVSKNVHGQMQVYVVNNQSKKALENEYGQHIARLGKIGNDLV